MTTPTRLCDVGCTGVHTTLYIQRMFTNDSGDYVVLCRDHAKSRRALGYTLRPVRRSKGMY